jgi:hypothetical protein
MGAHVEKLCSYHGLHRYCIALSNALLPPLLANLLQQTDGGALLISFV